MYVSRRILLCLAAAPLLVSAAPQGKGKGKGQNKAPDSSPAALRFRSQDVRIIVDYYHPAGGLPPGLAKRNGELPPGLEKQLRRNGKLPPGLEKKLAPFPSELEVKLPPVPSGCRRVTLGTWALLIRDATNVILDVIDLTRR
jgi:hypothetical protein